jgi:hypothetical protein
MWQLCGSHGTAHGSHHDHDGRVHVGDHDSFARVCGRTSWLWWPCSWQWWSVHGNNGSQVHIYHDCGDGPAHDEFLVEFLALEVIEVVLVGHIVILIIGHAGRSLYWWIADRNISMMTPDNKVTN